MDIIAAIVTFIVATIFLCMALYMVYMQLIIKRTNLVPIGDALSPTMHGSIVAMQGQVKCDAPFKAPLSITPCVYYKMNVKFGSTTIADETRSMPFVLHDGTGRIKIDIGDNAFFYKADLFFDRLVSPPEQGDLKIGHFSRTSALIQKDILQEAERRQDQSRLLPLPHVPETNTGKDDKELPELGVLESDVDDGHNSQSMYEFNEEGFPVGCELYVRGEVYREEDKYYLREPKDPTGAFKLLSKINKGNMILSIGEKSGSTPTIWWELIISIILSGLLFALGFYIIEQ